MEVDLEFGYSFAEVVELTVYLTYRCVFVFWYEGCKCPSGLCLSAQYSEIEQGRTYTKTSSIASNNFIL